MLGRMFGQLVYCMDTMGRERYMISAIERKKQIMWDESNNMKSKTKIKTRWTYCTVRTSESHAKFDYFIYVWPGDFLVTVIVGRRCHFLKLLIS